MASTTSRLALRYPGLSDAPNVPSDIQHLAEDVDALLSTLRPIASAAARSALTAHVGLSIWRTDRSWAEVYIGSSAWRVVGTATVTNFADLATYITSPFAGQLAYVTSEQGTYRYNGSAWTPLPYQQVTMTGSNQAVSSANSGTTLVSIAGLSAAVVANAKYQVDIWLPYMADVAGDLKFGWTVPALATFIYDSVSTPSGATVIDGESYMGVTDISASTIAGGVGAGIKVRFGITGSLITGANAGTFQPQYAQNAAHANSTTILAGARMTLTRVP